MKTIDDVKSVYTGVNGACCCGCKGTHSESDRSKKIVWNKIMKDPNHVFEGDDHVYSVAGNRIRIAYFT